MRFTKECGCQVSRFKLQGREKGKRWKVIEFCPAHTKQQNGATVYGYSGPDKD